MSGFVLNVYQASCVCSLISLNAIVRARLVTVQRYVELAKMSFSTVVACRTTSGLKRVEGKPIFEYKYSSGDSLSIILSFY